MYLDLRGCVLDLTEIVKRKFNASCSDIFVESRKLRCARDWNNPRLLGKQPGERDLSRCRILSFCDLAKQSNQGLIRFTSLRRKARERVAEVRAVKRRARIDLAGEESLSTVVSALQSNIATVVAKTRESATRSGWRRQLFSNIRLPRISTPPSSPMTSSPAGSSYHPLDSGTVPASTRALTLCPVRSRPCGRCRTNR